MVLHRRIDRNILGILGAGFGLTILLLLGSGYSGIQTMEAVEKRGAILHERQRMNAHLIAQLQDEEAGLSSIFYALAAEPRVAGQAELYARLEDIDRRVQETLGAAMASPSAGRWEGVDVAATQFLTEVRQLLETPGEAIHPPPSLYRAHETLVNALARLSVLNFESAVDEAASEGFRGRTQLQRSLVLLATALLLSVICAAVTVYVAGRVFRRMEWQSRELSRLSAHVLETQEEILHRISRELHDEFGQNLTAIEANLAAIPRPGQEVASRVEDCLLLVKDAMSNVRDMAQIMRPSTLDDFGLVVSLQFLVDSFAQRTDVAVEHHLQFDGRLAGETETHFFRIAQEALTNVARHSGATQVKVSLERCNGHLRLAVSDNGRGLRREGHKKPGFGLIGMRERMRSLGGELSVRSGPEGLTVVAEVPLVGIEQES
ncbi:MAG: sensor histidine kinase [Bryobacterales bacterium]